MDTLKYKEYEGTAELDMTRGFCRGKVLFIDDLVTYESVLPTELQKEFEAAVEDYLQTCAAVGKEPQRPFRGLFNVRVTPALHRAATLRALVDGVSLNDVVCRSLDAFLTVKADVNHNTRLTVVKPDGSVGTFPSFTSGAPQWRTQHAH